MDGYFHRFGDDAMKAMLYRYSNAMRNSPHDMIVLRNLPDVDPRQALAELKEKDPVGYANLTEHIVMPWEDS